MMKSDSEDLYQVALLIDQLKHDNVQLRITASKNLVRIAQALGTERTREELIPFLGDWLDDNEDVLKTIAGQLGELINYIGGNEHVYILLEPLQALCTVEESSVREAANRSIALVVKNLPAEHVENYYVAFLTRLATKDWFTSRMSAAALTHIGYPRLSVYGKQTFRTLFLRLCSDDTPLVRKTASEYIGCLAKMATSEEVFVEFLPVLVSLAEDDQDAVRVKSIRSCIDIASVMSPDNISVKIVPLVSKYAADKSWRVRWSLANNLHEFRTGGESSAVSVKLCGIMDALLNDSEAEVRAAAASTVNLFAAKISKSDLINRIFPSVGRLVTDLSEHVRASLANVVSDFAPTLGVDDTVEHLVPILLQFLRDETADVRLNVISNLDKISYVVGVDLLGASLLPAVQVLAQDSKWRVRMSLIEHMPMLAKRLGSEYFNSRMREICMGWLCDSVSTVRIEAAANIRKLAEIFGDAWIREELLPQLEEIRGMNNFIARLSFLTVVKELVNVASREVVESHLLPMLIAMSADAVPNIRLTAVRIMQEAVLRMNHLNGVPQSPTEAVSTLERLVVDDDDCDVRYFSKQALRGIHTAIMSTN